MPPPPNLKAHKAKGNPAFPRLRIPARFVPHSGVFSQCREESSVTASGTERQCRDKRPPGRIRHWLRPAGCPPVGSGQAKETHGCLLVIVKGGEEVNSGWERAHSMLPELASDCTCLPGEAAKAPLLGDSFRTQALWTHARKYRLLKVASQLLSPSQETPALQPHLAGLLKASS